MLTTRIDQLPDNPTGLTIRYNHTKAEIIASDLTHIVVRLKDGGTYCLGKRGFSMNDVIEKEK